VRSAVIVYYSREPPRDVIEKLVKAGFSVELRRACDVDIMLVGPFGIVKGYKAVKIIANQMSPSG